MTNTAKYYSGEEVERLGIKYHKIMVPGQEVIPEDAMDNLLKTLHETVQSVKADSGEVVGIHCTHGVNRTGYVLAVYLCQ